MSRSNKAIAALVTWAARNEDALVLVATIHLRERLSTCKASQFHQLKKCISRGHSAEDAN